MAFYNTNYEAKFLPAGSYTAGDLGNGITASTVHQIFCLQDGGITITAIGGGTFTWAAVSGQSINVLVGSCIVNTGEFVGFKAQFNSAQQLPYYR